MPRCRRRARRVHTVFTRSCSFAPRLPFSYCRVTEEAKHNHDDGWCQDDPEHQSSEARVDCGDQHVLSGHQHRAGPAVERSPQLQRSLASPAATLSCRIRRRHNHTWRCFSPSTHSRGGCQGVGMVKMLLLVVVGVVVVVVRWQFLRQVQGLMVCPPLESTGHTHNELCGEKEIGTWSESTSRMRRLCTSLQVFWRCCMCGQCVGGWRLCEQSGVKVTKTTELVVVGSLRGYMLFLSGS